LVVRVQFDRIDTYEIDIHLGEDGSSQVAEYLVNNEMFDGIDAVLLKTKRVVRGSKVFFD
jgi:hypothetical protein